MSDLVLTSKIPKDHNSAQIQELNDVQQFLKMQRIKHAKYKILYDTVQECITSSNSLDTELKTKVRNILLSHSCTQVVPLDNEVKSEESSSLLGLSDNLNGFELGFEEASKLKKCIVTSLDEKYKKLCQEFSKVIHKDIGEVTSPSSHDVLDFNLSSEENGLFEFRRKLNEQQNYYLCNLLEEQKILGDITKLRLEDLPLMCNTKIKEYQIKSNMNALRSKIVQDRTRASIFLETNKSFNAYEELMKDIKEQQEECKNEIDNLKKLKEKYNQIAGKQFNDLLKTYIQYKASLEKKQLLYESLKN